MHNYFATQPTAKVNQVTSATQLQVTSSATTISVITASFSLLLFLVILIRRESHTSSKRRQIQRLEQIWQVNSKDNFK
ncbi:MAG: hypothetical protein KME64_14385 [Scytonematopsis contorta HA4267-MV1]|nr:hypothetical protein [Scytonematopsis contorta HA4267-MV1]